MFNSRKRRRDFEPVLSSQPWVISQFRNLIQQMFSDLKSTPELLGPLEGIILIEIAKFHRKLYESTINNTNQTSEDSLLANNYTSLAIAETYFKQAIQMGSYDAMNQLAYLYLTQQEFFKSPMRLFRPEKERCIYLNFLDNYPKNQNQITFRIEDIQNLIETQKKEFATIIEEYYDEISALFSINSHLIDLNFQRLCEHFSEQFSTGYQAYLESHNTNEKITEFTKQFSELAERISEYRSKTTSSAEDSNEEVVGSDEREEALSPAVIKKPRRRSPRFTTIKSVHFEKKEPNPPTIGLSKT